MTLVGIDPGGTFTDFVLGQGGELRVHKVLSTPQAPERAILRGITELGLDPEGLVGVHGSTVATNAMQSSGETIAAHQAARQSVRLLLSGPAGGLAGAAFTTATGGAARLLSFDMGGTSTDVAVIDGEPRQGPGRSQGPRW